MTGPNRAAEMQRMSGFLHAQQSQYLTGLRPSPPSRVAPADVRDEGSGRCLTVALCVPLLAAHRRQVAFWGRGPTGALP